MWNETKRDVKRLGVEFEQRVLGSLQLLALMRIITLVITLAYLREWRGRTSGCVCEHACVCACICAHSISLAVSASFPGSQYLFVSPQ